MGVLMFLVRIEAGNGVRAVRVVARDAQDAQCKAIGFFEFNGVVHGAILSIKRI
jgi:hypothetical protein